MLVGTFSFELVDISNCSFILFHINLWFNNRAIIYSCMKILIFRILFFSISFILNWTIVHQYQLYKRFFVEAIMFSYLSNMKGNMSNVIFVYTYKLQAAGLNFCGVVYHFQGLITCLAWNTRNQALLFISLFLRRGFLKKENFLRYPRLQKAYCYINTSFMYILHSYLGHISQFHSIKVDLFKCRMNWILTKKIWTRLYSYFVLLLFS